MKQVWKFQLLTSGEMEMPEGAKVISARGINEVIFIWAEVNPTAPAIPTTVSVYGTGHPIPTNPGRFVDTVFLDRLGLVFHIYQPSTE